MISEQEFLCQRCANRFSLSSAPQILRADHASVSPLWRLCRFHLFLLGCDLRFLFCYHLGEAMKAGIDATHSRYVGYIDADLQTTPEDFNLLLEHIADYQLVMGIRAGRKDSFFKNLQSKIANGFRNMMTHDGAKDTGCPLKVMWTDYAKRIPFFTGMHRFLPALIQLQEGRMMQIPVRHFPRTEGVSKYHLWNRLVGPFKDCFAYRWMRKRYINYQIGEGNV